MAVAQEKKRQDVEEKLTGSGLCNHSGSKVPSGLDSPRYK